MRKFIITSAQIRANAVRAVMEIRGEDNAEVIIQPHKKSKSAEQRGWFHVLCKILGEETGYTQGEIKELIKREIMGTTLIELAGRNVEVVASSESLDKVGYSELIDGTYVLAAEAGIVLPNPRYRE